MFIINSMPVLTFSYSLTRLSKSQNLRGKTFDSSNLRNMIQVIYQVSARFAVFAGQIEQATGQLI